MVTHGQSREQVVKRHLGKNDSKPKRHSRKRVPAQQSDRFSGCFRGSIVPHRSQRRGAGPSGGTVGILRFVSVQGPPVYFAVAAIQRRPLSLEALFEQHAAVFAVLVVCIAGALFYYRIF